MANPPSSADSRPSTARPRTSTGRPPTATYDHRPGTTSSTLSNGMPLTLFQPDPEPVGEEGEEGDESEVEEDIFAFHRPETGAPRDEGAYVAYNALHPPHVQGRPANAGESTDDVFAFMPPVRAPGLGLAHPDYTQTFSRAAPPSAAAGSSVGVPIPSELNAPPPWRGLPALDTSSFISRPSTATTSAFSTSTRPGRRASSSRHGGDFRPHTAQTVETEEGYSRAVPAMAGQSYPLATMSPYDGRDAREADERAKAWAEAHRDGRSELEGATTVPDGVTTRGGGEPSITPEELIVPELLATQDAEGSQVEQIVKDGIAADLWEDDSPYIEVRVSVSNIDDLETPTLTFRVWVIGIPLAMIVSGAQVFFYLRQNSPSIPAILVIFVAWPFGKILEWVLPIRDFEIPSWFPFIGGSEFSINPGPFSIKEHALIAMLATIAEIAPYSVGVTATSSMRYGHPFAFGFEVLLMFVCQMTGLCFAGLLEPLLIAPPSLLWPQNLIVCTTLNALHSEVDGEDGRMSRLKFLEWVSAGAFIWYFVPGFLVQCLAYFTFVCWAAPNNIVVNQLFGSVSGLGMNIISFDWSVISGFASPLMIPWWAQANLLVGFIMSFWIILPAMYYSNSWNFAYLPIMTSQAFDRFGLPYNYTSILTAQTTLDVKAYADYSPLYLSGSFVTMYFCSIAVATTAIVHMALYYRAPIWAAIRGRQLEKEDIHARMMKKYPTVPRWWYGVLFVICFVLGVCAVQVYDTKFPVWGLLLAIIIPAVYAVPAGYVFAMTGFAPSLTNIVSQITTGYLFPGMPIPGMISKGVSVQTLLMSTRFSQNMKLGHYIKIPPRHTFFIQVVGTSVMCLSQAGVKVLLFRSQTICTPDDPKQLTCPTLNTFFTASVLWSLIGPERQWGPLALYHPALWAFLIGALLPVTSWVLMKKYPRGWTNKINFVIILSGSVYLPGSPALLYTSFFLVGFITQYVLRRKYFDTWSKYNYVGSAGLDAGTCLSIIFIFLTLVLPKAGTISLDWIGNTINDKTLDFKGDETFRPVPETGFGPSSWPT